MTNSNEESKLETSGSRCCSRGRFWKFPFIVATIILVKSAIVMLLWNALIPDLFHAPVLTYLQALGLTVLAKLVFGFPGFRQFPGRYGGPPWKARWAGLSPEEREELREDIRKHFGDKPST